MTTIVAALMACWPRLRVQEGIDQLRRRQRGVAAGRHDHTAAQQMRPLRQGQEPQQGLLILRLTGIRQCSTLGSTRKAHRERELQEVGLRAVCPALFDLYTKHIALRLPPLRLRFWEQAYELLWRLSGPAQGT